MKKKVKYMYLSHEYTGAQTTEQYWGPSTQVRLLYQRRGDCCITIKGESYRLLTGDLIILSPGEDGACRTFSPDHQLLVLNFCEDLGPKGASVPKSLKSFQDRLWLRDERGLISALCHRLIERSTASRLSPDQSTGLTQGLFSELSILRADQLARAPHEGGYVRRALAYIEGHYYRKLSVDEVADTLRISGRHLQALFKKEMGETVLDRIQTVKLEKARGLLVYTDLAMSDIAAKVGFSNQQYFSTHFKKKMGLTPSAYRQKHQYKK